jgi:hypothetical protein
MSSSVVCFHYPCPDGAFGALAAHLALRASSSSSSSTPAAAVRFVPLTVYGSADSRASIARTFTKEDTVFLVDFSGGPAFITLACEFAGKVVLIDHHKTAADDLAALGSSLAPNFESFVDMARSGCALARDYFHLEEDVLTEANGWTKERAAALLRAFAYVEDNDLWRHALPDSKLFTAGFADQKLEYDPAKNAGVFDALCAVDVDALVARGKEVVEEQDRIIAAELATSSVVRIPYMSKPPPASAAPAPASPPPLPAASDCDAVFEVLAVTTAHPDYRSVAGNRLAEKSAAASLVAGGVIVYTEAALGDQTLKVSCRSIGDVDTTPVSRTYGGGGHKNASSFTVPKAVYEGWLVAAKEGKEGEEGK